MLLSSSDFKLGEHKNQKMETMEVEGDLKMQDNATIGELVEEETQAEKARNLKVEYISHVLPLKFTFQSWVRDSHGLYDFEGNSQQICKQNIVADNIGTFFVVRENQKIELKVPTSGVNEYEDGDNNTVLFKVICVQGKYFIYHKETLFDEDFCDTSHMIHYVIKSFKPSKVKQVAGEVL